MVRLRTSFLRTTAAFAVGAFLSLPLIATAADGEVEGVVGKTKLGATRDSMSGAKRIDGPKWTDAKQVGDGEFIMMEYQVPGQKDTVVKFGGRIVNTGTPSPEPVHVFGADDSNRALGDNNLLLYSAPGQNAIASFTNNYVGDDVITIPFGTKGQAFAIEEFDVGALLVAGGVDTWVEVVFWDLDEDADFNCTFVPNDVSVRGQKYGRVVANLGRDINSPACNLSIANSAIRRVNLLTGVVSGYGDAPLRVIDSNGVKVNTIGAADLDNTGRGIPMGPGDLSEGSSATGLALQQLQHQMLFEIRYGIKNGTSDGVVTAPVDACSQAILGPATTFPGGWVLFGASTLAQFSDPFAWGDFDPQDGNPTSCNEAFGFLGETSVSVSMVIRGSRDSDCDTNGIVDEIQLDLSPSDDDGTLCTAAVAANGIVDACECLDCNLNGFFDVEEIAAGTSPDCNNDNIPDDCQLFDNDCNTNGIPDDCDIGTIDVDCQGNGVPDLCDLDPSDPDGNGFFSVDCDGNSVIDFCERVFRDCTANGVEDFCDILFSNANDFNANGIPDSCDAAGLNVVMDFEDASAFGDPNLEYAIGPIHDQPFDDDDLPVADPTGVVNADWATIDFDAGAFTGAAGLADVTAGASACGGVKTLVVSEDAARSLGYQSPAIPFSSPDVGTVSVFIPTIHSISFDIAFSADNYQVDWDFFFDNIFDSASNSWRAFLQFETRSDATREIVLFHGTGTENTGIDWFTGAGVSHNVKLEIDYSGTNFELENAGTLYWDGNPIATFSPRDQDGPLSGAFPFMHRFTLQNDVNTSGLGAPADGTISLDCITYTSSEENITCSDYKLPGGATDSDCDLDGVCDSFQLALDSTADLNNNGTLDWCEGFCGDCNHNRIPDSFEIASGSATDTDLNGVPDVCDRLTHSNSFEATEFGADGFTAGLLDNQQGWQVYLDAEAEVSTAATPFKTGSQFVIVRDGPGAVGADGLVLGPRFDKAGDADLELFAWDWRTTADVGDIGLVQVEILDICLDGPAVTGDATSIFLDSFTELDAAGNAGAGNVGLRVRPDIAGPDVDTTFDVEMLGISDGARQYSGALSDVQDDFRAAAGISAGIRINNRTGELRGFWAADQTAMSGYAQYGPPDQSIHSPANHVETQTITSFPAAGTTNVKTSGGDRQVLIRITNDTNIGQFGAANDVEYWFDNFTYQTFPDCDFDGLNDLLFVEDSAEPVATAFGFGQANDKNNDNIPDRCQDCDDDCTWNEAVATAGGNIQQLVSADTSCLDPCEINGAASGCTGGGGQLDCNANGVPDHCDTAFGLVDNGDATDGFLFIGNYDAGVACIPFGAGSLNLNCRYVRSGGGSGDADADGVPDECQISGGADDCNENGLVDLGEIAAGTAADDNSNSIPDECEADCNNNGRLDSADLQGAGGNSPDFNPADSIPDECCPSGQLAGDLDGDGDVDAADYLFMQECGGEAPGTPGTPGPNGAGVGIVAGQVGFSPPSTTWACGCGDLNGDGIIDECDMQIFQLIITGP